MKLKDDDKMWKNIYAEKYEIERNWKKGFFTIREFKGHSSSLCCLQINEKLGRLVTGSHDKTIRIWDIESGECIKVLEGHTDTVYGYNLMNRKLFLSLVIELSKFGILKHLNALRHYNRIWVTCVAYIFLITYLLLDVKMELKYGI
jgi:WD40 repeat protein